MNLTKVFNPEHDMALSNGDRHFIAPQNIRDMARDLSPLMSYVGSDGPLVWGWDHAICEQLLRMGIPADELPSAEALASLRGHSGRQSAHELLSMFHAQHAGGPYTGESIIVTDTDQLTPFVARHHHVILKAPYSSSGKGLRHVTTHPNPPCEGGKSSPAESTSISTPSPTQGGQSSPAESTSMSTPYLSQGGESSPTESASISTPSPSQGGMGRISSWANALIRRHGYLTAEPCYNKVQDFAMEFIVTDDTCRFIGYSLFNTNAHGRYEANLLMEDEAIELLLAQHVPLAALHEVREWIIAHAHHIVPAVWDTTRHPLYFGIDMMVVKDGRQCTIDNPKLTIQDSEFKIQNSEFKLHPCVEINLRLNMGIIAHEVRRQLVAPGSVGTFHVTTFASTEDALQFQECHATRYPTCTDTEGLIVAGYHPLTPIYPHTRHHAYIVCRPQDANQAENKQH